MGLNLLDLIVLEGLLPAVLLLLVLDLGIVYQVGVKGKGALGDKGGEEEDDADDRIHDTTDAEQGGMDVPVVGVEVVINNLSEDGAEGGVENDVERVQEGHDGTERRDLIVGVLHLGEGRLDVGSKGDITGSPTEGDGDPDGGQGPGIGKGFGGIGVGVGEDPDDQETESIETQPGDGSLDGLGKEEDEEGTEKLTKVGTTDHDLGVGRLAKDVLGKGGREL